MRSFQKYVVPAPQLARYHGGLRTTDPTMIVVHATAGDTADGAMSWLNRVTNTAESPAHRASYHYIIDKPWPRIVRFLPPDYVAWHAGASWWPTPPVRKWGVWQSVNRISLGVAFANDNGADNDERDDALTAWQFEAGLWLCVTLCRKYNIPPERVLGHREVSPGRKTDPLPRVLNMDAFRAAIKQELEAHAA